jgi:hypothetical protein
VSTLDLSATLFTNTLPIRRFGLGSGQSRRSGSSTSAFPISRSRSTAGATRASKPGRRYRYESVDSDFTRGIEVDDDGLVVTYPGLFRRTL